jgi:hypothetical protein
MLELALSIIPWKIWIVIIIVAIIFIWIVSRDRSGKIVKKIKSIKEKCSWQQWFSDNPDFGNDKISLSEVVPIVGRSKSETLAVNAFAQLLKNRGAKIENLKIGYRPDFLINPVTGKNLELDAYYDDWRMALEYNGIQHYVFPNKFHPNTPEGEKAYIDTVKRDRYKRSILNNHDICLITVPYHVDTCVECKRGSGGYRFQQHTNEQKWDRLVKFIDKKIEYCMKNLEDN